jgi:cytochrome P450
MAEGDLQVGSKQFPIELDHDTPEHAANWPERWRAIRESSPRAWTQSHGGFWVATRLEDLVGIAQRDDVFSTHKELDRTTGETSGGLSIPPVPGIRSIPNESDKPEWNGIRGFINRHFAPRAVEQRRQRARQYTAALVDMVIEKGEFDIVDDLTNPLPALVTMDLFGFPLAEWRAFADPFHTMVYTPASSPEFASTIRGLDHFHARLDEEIALRRLEPKDDLLTILATGRIDGELLSYDNIHDLAFNILAGGVDTTTALTSNTLLYLARHPDQRQELIDRPDILPLAREEFIRYFSPIHGLARNAMADVEINGWKIDKGDRVLLAYSAANRDPEAFEDPEDVKLDRFPNKHVGFGAGMHRCIGSFLARMMWESMVTEVLARMPDYRVDESQIESYHTVAKVNGWIHIPATFTPAKKVGATIA